VIIFVGHTIPVAAQVTATRSADWDSPDTWNVRRVPSPNGDDDVVIPAGITVKVSRNLFKLVNSLRVAGTLDGNPPGLGYSIKALKNIVVDGVVKDASSLDADGEITINGVVETGSTGTDFRMEAVGNIQITGNGRVIPGAVLPPVLAGGKRTTIKSTKGNVTIAAGLTAGLVEGMRGSAVAQGGGVDIEAEAPGKVITVNGIIRGGAPGGGLKKGVVQLVGDRILGRRAKIESDLNIFALVREQIPGGTIGVALTELETGAITAEGGPVTIATCPGGAVDLRGNIAPDIIVSSESVIVEAETIFIDPGVLLSELTSPPAMTPQPSQTSLRDLNGNGIADFCEEKVVNDMVSLSSAPATSFNSTPVPGSPAGTFTIRATFTNTSATPIPNPFFQVAELSGGNLLLNADGDPGGVGARLTPDVGADGVLAPRESITVDFLIGLQARRRFSFFVDLLGLLSP
jgi:hypothetical protein